MRSTLAACLAVRAMKDGRVAIIDWEPQGSLSIWHKLRGSPDNPHLHVLEKGDLGRDVTLLKALGYETIVIDTSPMEMEPISRAINAADLVVVPTRVGLFDIGGIRPVIGFCQEQKRPFLFVLTGTNPKSAGWPKLIRDAVTTLKKHGPVASRSVRERAAHISALNSGKTGAEIDKEARADVDALWLVIKRRAGQR
jgi:cellulose biosynthesis protein BcsQ